MREEEDWDSGDFETLDALKAPVGTLEELCDRFLPTVAARVWATCCWPARMADGWKLGDYRFIVLSVSPDTKTNLYVQFWSEPGEPVLVEVCSGEWSPGVVKYLQESQRRKLRTLGFTKGGPAGNFGKMIDVHDVGEAENAAREALRIFFDVFGFRGQWPLQIQPECGERTEQMPVLSSVTTEDFAKLLAEHGYKTMIPDVDDTALVLLQGGRRRFTARFDGRVPKQDLYCAVILDAMLQPAGRIPDDAVVSLNNEIAGVTVCRAEDGALRLSMLMRLDGGVTEAWILKSIDYWLMSVRRCERSLQTIARRRPSARDRDRPRVH